MAEDDKAKRTERRLCLSPGSIGGGGIGVVMLNLAEELIAQGVKVDLLIVAPDGIARPVPQGVRIIDLGSRARRGLRRAVSYINEARPDAVISARPYVNLLMLAAHWLARGRHTRQLIWTHHTHRSSELTHARVGARFIDGLTLSLSAFPNAHVAVSEGVAVDIRQAFASKSQAEVKVIPNPAWTAARAMECFSSCPHPWLKHREPRIVRGAALAGDPILIGMGRFVPQKDFPTLLRAFARLRLTNPSARLVLLGDGPERSVLSGICTELGLRLDQDVALPGHVEQPMAWLSRADLFVHSAMWEGLPMALVEALGAGLPVVATDCPSGPDEILDHGRFGWLVPPGNVQALTEAMQEALAQFVNPAGQVTAAERYNAHQAAGRYLRLAFPPD